MAELDGAESRDRQRTGIRPGQSPCRVRVDAHDDAGASQRPSEDGVDVDIGAILVAGTGYHDVRNRGVAAAVDDGEGDRVEFGSTLRRQGAGDRAVRLDRNRVAGQHAALARPEHFTHDVWPCVMAQPDHMADFMQQDALQIDAAKGVAGSISLRGLAVQSGGEFCGVGGRGIDKPAVAGGGGIQENRESVGGAELGARQVGDMNLHSGEVCREVSRHTGRRPLPQRFGEDRSENLVGQQVAIGGPARQRIVKNAGNQQLPGDRRPLQIHLGRIGQVGTVRLHGIVRDPCGSQPELGGWPTRQVGDRDHA